MWDAEALVWDLRDPNPPDPPPDSYAEPEPAAPAPYTPVVEVAPPLSDFSFKVAPFAIMPFTVDERPAPAPYKGEWQARPVEIKEVAPEPLPFSKTSVESRPPITYVNEAGAAPAPPPIQAPPIAPYLASFAPFLRGSGMDYPSSPAPSVPAPVYTPPPPATSFLSEDVTLAEQAHTAVQPPPQQAVYRPPSIPVEVLEVEAPPVDDSGSPPLPTVADLLSRFMAPLMNPAQTSAPVAIVSTPPARIYSPPAAEPAGISTSNKILFAQLFIAFVILLVTLHHYYVKGRIL